MTCCSHDPVRGDKAANRACARGRSGMTRFARSRGQNVRRRFAQHHGRDSRAHICPGMASGASSRHAGMVHRRVRCRKASNRANASGGSGMAGFTRCRGRGVIRRLAQHNGRDARAHICAGVAGGASSRHTGMVHRRVRCRKASGAGIGSGVTRFTRSRGRSVVGGFAFYHRSSQRSIPGWQVAAGTSRGVAVGGVIHCPVGSRKAAGAGTGC